MRVLGTLLVLGCGLTGTLQAQGPSPAPARPEALMAHIRFLADDLLEGRLTGTRGFDLAALYVAAQFEALGLTPAGSTPGSYLQPVPLRVARVDEASARGEWSRGERRESLTYASDLVLVPSFHATSVDLEAGVVFVGYGIDAPELGHDDYAGVDVRGKVVAYLFGAPAGFPNDQRAHWGQVLSKVRTAAAKGATGMLMVRTKDAQPPMPWTRLVDQLRQPAMRWLDDQGRPADTPEGIRASGLLSAEAAERLFEAAGRPLGPLAADVKAGRGASFDLGATLRLHVESRHEQVSSPNVVGLLPGGDVSGETVVVSAHLDHVGVGVPREGDAIYNGAYDNASGVAGMLELARVLAAGPRPRRNVAFVAVTGEERGLLGSDYFARRPTAPGIVGNLNLDMITMLTPLLDVIAYGAEHSSLGGVVERAARAEGLELSPDPFPEQFIFVRSDHYSFVRQGVPAIYLFPGLKRADSRVDGKAEAMKWVQARYHAPQDDLSQPFDTQAGARFVGVAARVLREMADGEQPPRWNEGDFFGETYGKQRTAAAAGPAPRRP